MITPQGFDHSPNEFLRNLPEVQFHPDGQTADVRRQVELAWSHDGSGRSGDFFFFFFFLGGGAETSRKKIKKYIDRERDG